MLKSGGQAKSQFLDYAKKQEQNKCPKANALLQLLLSNELYTDTPTHMQSKVKISRVTSIRRYKININMYMYMCIMNLKCKCK